jgi:hypothetical protein
MSAKLFFKQAAGTVRALVDKAGEKVEVGLHLHNGDPIPDNILPAELTRLKKLGAVGEQASVKVVSAFEPAPATEPAAAGEKAPAAVDLTGLDTNGVANLINTDKPSAHALIEAVGADKTLAQTVLDGERVATKGDPRKSLVTGLEKVIAAE